MYVQVATMHQAVKRLIVAPGGHLNPQTAIGI